MGTTQDRTQAGQATPGDGWTNHTFICESCGRRTRVQQSVIDEQRRENSYPIDATDEQIASELSFCLKCVNGEIAPEHVDELPELPVIAATVAAKGHVPSPRRNRNAGDSSSTPSAPTTNDLMERLQKALAYCPIGCPKPTHCEGCDQCDPSTRERRAHVRGLAERETIAVRYCNDCERLVNGGTHDHFDAVSLTAPCHMCGVAVAPFRCLNCKQPVCAGDVVIDAVGRGRHECNWCFRLSGEERARYAASLAGQRSVAHA